MSPTLGDDPYGVLVLVLLPPSEGKRAPTRGRPLDLTTLSFPSLTAPRSALLDAVAALGTGPDAAAVLGVGAGLREELARNGRLRTAPAARADRVYTGVLYDALGLTTLPTAAKRRAASRVLIASALFGLLRPADRVPAYRLSAGVRLPALGPVASVWRPYLGAAVASELGSGLLVDLRSTGYAAFWRPPTTLAPRTATVRVLHEVAGRRTIVSHFNKATKGRLVRALLEDGATPRTPAALADVVRDLGWTVETESEASGTRLDVVVRDLA